MSAYLSKKDSQVLYGLAAVIMMYHHVFAVPWLILWGLIDGTSGKLYISLFPAQEQILRSAFKICISIFAFITGYGLFIKCTSISATGYHRLIEAYKLIWKHLLKFYMHYWMVFLVFVPIGIIKRILPLNDFMSNLIGYNSSYNGTWWYVWQYVTMLILFPMIEYILSPKINLVHHRIVYTFCLFGLIVIYLLQYKFKIIHIYMDDFEDSLAYILVLTEGILFCKYDLFSRIKEAGVSISILGLILWIPTMAYLPYKIAVLIATPMLIFSFISAVRSLSLHRIEDYLFFIGRYSIYIWLAHFFYLVLYWPRIALQPRISWLIGIWLLILALVTGIVLEKIYKCIFQRV